MLQRTSTWMAVSGVLGFGFFLVANFSFIFLELNILSALVQVVINGFVFVTWRRGYRESSGFKKFVTFWGVVTPIVMASITIWRVIIPALFP